ncbi:MAG TPA: hypothetical protein VF246_07645 [Acidimicrobiia bacterium]
MRPPVAALAPLAAALAWTVALIVRPDPFPVIPSVLLIGIGLLVLGTTATTGLVVLGARWAHRLAWLVLLAGGGIAAVRPIDVTWVAALVVTMVSAGALVSLQGRLRKLPSATGPPDQAVLLPLVQLSSPLAIGLTGSGETWAVMVMGLGALVAAFLYARVVFGGLVVSRVVWPALGLSLTPFLEPAALVVTVALVAATLALAWHPLAKAAFHPPRTVGSTFPIPPELTPPEILDAAGLDERGRRKS